MKVLGMACIKWFFIFTLPCKLSKSLESGNDCQSVILDDGLVEMNHAKSNFWKVIPPMSWKSKLKCRRVKEARATTICRAICTSFTI